MNQTNCPLRTADVNADHSPALKRSAGPVMFLLSPHLPTFRSILLWTTPSQWTPHLHPTESYQPTE
jgi:hypothetical protein